MIKALTNRAPEFLKQTWASPVIDLINHEGEVMPEEKFLVYRNKLWMVYRMTQHRVPVPCGTFSNMSAAINKARH